MGNIPRKYRIKTGKKNYEKTKVEVVLEAGVTDGTEKRKINGTKEVKTDDRSNEKKR
jgi:hypothetical protein